MRRKESAEKSTDSCCREEATRTPDPYVPNVVRYQLRYFSKKKDAKCLASSLFAFTAYASLLM